MTPRNNSNTIFAKTKSEIFFQKSRIPGLQLQSMVDLISIANTAILSIENTKNKIKLILGKIINLFSSAPREFFIFFYLSTIKGRIKDGQLFFTQIKEDKRTGEKWLVSVFPVGQ